MMRRLPAITATVSLLVSVTCPLGYGQPDPTSKENVQLLPARILEVKGLVSVREQLDQPWVRAKKDMLVSQGADLRTGPRSHVKFAIDPGQIVFLDRLGTIKILQAVLDQKQKKVKTDLGMKYGRARYDVQAAGVVFESMIHSPNATLAVRGTDAQIQAGDGFPTTITSHRGQILATIHGYRAVSIGSDRRSTVSQQRRTPVNQARRQTRIDPKTGFAGRTAPEHGLVEDLPALGGIDMLKFLRFSDSAPPYLAATGIRPNFDDLSIDMAYFGTPNLTDLNLLVISPLDEVVSAQRALVPSGGEHTGNAIANSPFGIAEETVQWNLNVPVGVYTAQVEFVSPGPDLDVTYNLFVELERATGESTILVNLANQPIQPGDPIQQHSFTVTPHHEKRLVVSNPTQ